MRTGVAVFYAAPLMVLFQVYVCLSQGAKCVRQVSEPLRNVTPLRTAQLVFLSLEDVRVCVSCTLQTCQSGGTVLQ